MKKPVTNLPPLPPLPISDRYDQNRSRAQYSPYVTSAADDDMWFTRWDVANGGVVQNVMIRELRKLFADTSRDQLSEDADARSLLLYHFPHWSVDSYDRVWTLIRKVVEQDERETAREWEQERSMRNAGG